MTKVIPKSILKIGVKLPEMGFSKSTPNLTEIEFKEEDIKSPREVQTTVNILDNPFILEDSKGLLGKNLFRPRLSNRFGQSNMKALPPPLPPPPQEQQPECFEDEVNIRASSSHHSQRERVRKELSAVLRTNSSGDLSVVTSSDVLLFPRRRTQQQQQLPPQQAFLGVSHCYRCSQPVYPMEKLEPSPGQRYHPQCFRCAVCQTKLSLSTFCRSLKSSRDSQVYCRSHQPRQDKVLLCSFTTRRSDFPAFKLSWQQGGPTEGGGGNCGTASRNT